LIIDIFKDEQRINDEAVVRAEAVRNRASFDTLRISYKNYCKKLLTNELKCRIIQNEQLNDCSTIGGDEMNKKDRLLCDCEVIHEDVVERVRSVMPESGDFHDLANLYKMYADFTRIRILWALSCEEMCVCDLAVLMGMTKSAISHQLKSLRLSSLVKYVKQGKVVYYTLADDHIKDIFTKGFEHIRE